MTAYRRGSLLLVCAWVMFFCLAEIFRRGFGAQSWPCSLALYATNMIIGFAVARSIYARQPERDDQDAEATGEPR